MLFKQNRYSSDQANKKQKPNEKRYSFALRYPPQQTINIPGWSGYIYILSPDTQRSTLPLVNVPGAISQFHRDGH